MSSRVAIVTGSDSGIEKASAYCAAKGGLGLLTKVMAVELGSTASPSTRLRRGSSPPS